MKVRDCGPLDARVYLVGEAPGEQEDREGLPFVGPSGKLLRGMLSHSGLVFEQCRVTNVANERPPGNDFHARYYTGTEKKPEPTQELLDLQGKLREKLIAHRPSVIIPLGKEALFAVTGKTSIRDWRGSWLSIDGIPVLPTYHPAAVMREWDLHPIVELDLKKAHTRKPKPFPLVTVEPSLVTVLKMLSSIPSGAPVSLDIETVELHVRAIALSFRLGTSIQTISIPLFRLGSTLTSSYWTAREECIVLEKIAHVLAEHPIIGQNQICFDAPIISQELGIQIPNHKIDLMHAWHLLYPEFPKGLDFIVSVLLDYPNYWTEKSASVDMEEWVYNGRDALVTLECSELVENELRAEGLYNLYDTLVHPLALELANVQKRGILIDRMARAVWIEKFREDAKNAKAAIEACGYPNLNPRSPDQLKTLLYFTLGLPKQMDKGKITTDAFALRRLKRQYKLPVLRHILDFKTAAHQLSNSFPEPDEDGRMRCSYNASGTDTGRLSSSKNIRGTGENLQNVSAGRGEGIPNVKNMFCAPPGRALTKSDLKQAETMVVAWKLASLGYPYLYERYQDPAFDIHIWACSTIFHIPESQVTKVQRNNIGKIANHSGNYMSGPRVMEMVALRAGIEDIDYSLAKMIIETRTKSLPGLTQWWGWVLDQLKSTRTLTNCFRRKRMFFGRLDESTQRTAVAWEPQSTVGDLTNTILVSVAKRLPPDSGIILQVHDEIVVEHPIERAAEVRQIIQECSQVELNIWPGHPLIIPAEISSGPNWKDCK